MKLEDYAQAAEKFEAALALDELNLEVSSGWTGVAGEGVG